ncbi:transcriptional regulator [Bacillus phage BigBertha]|uniref:Helix-turn-helix DNA binding domain protein n=8 Tax=Caudoviricetes TaxID=2731619 RepID=A0A7U3TT56_9CAUD|nr:transcriptional regulator [Bacillus phage Troll]YP_008771096.1 transcriptional regulator [Bacillus phage BigBertha]YP_009055831.1 transcriptional regulator [Bacillus phage Riley]YP_009206425.1 transcriptional regulator [Bacillus phage AvesoBmore]YP_009289948.1 transcriptional regulator [Bacillus phage Phrodo]AMW61501.1 DNA-binding protein [Bacillus phage Juglone]ASZ75800.1 helix-turn-helix DNA binding domain protein [Bacillus phage Taffo16]QDH49759.1 helix-turn-helix binding domain protei
MTKKERTPKRLKKYRMDAGYTTYSLGDKLGVSFSTVSNWEGGLKFPRPEKLMLLEDLFKVGYRELFEDLSEDENRELESKRYGLLEKKNRAVEGK